MNEPMTLAVTTHVVGLGSGRQTPPVYVELGEHAVSARTLLAEHVRSEVNRSLHCREMSLALHYMLTSDLHSQPQPLREVNAPTLDVARETARAYAGLAEGRFLLMVDGLAITDLDSPLILTELSRVGFVRLLPLIGG
ncbi:MAG: hypothetical protein H0T53_15865 [Herpetosiphonaceae bacterium]|nr:hypothetical protein [Herpetosiphonaceae bacterium]